MAKALDSVCAQLEEKITARATQVKNNGVALDALPAASSVAFQDRAMLISLAPAALNKIIDERLAQFEKSRAQAEAAAATETAAESTAEESTAEESTAEASGDESDVPEADKTAPGSAATDDSSTEAASEPAIPDPFAVIAEDDASNSFEITLHIKTGEKTAIAIMDALKQQYGDKPGFVEVSLRATIA